MRGHRLVSDQDLSIRMRCIPDQLRIWSILSGNALGTGRGVFLGDTMQRRAFITLFGGSVATWSFAARAQQPARRVYRVGWLSIGSREQTLYGIKAFEEG